MRADRARAALTEGIIGRLWCPSSRGARREPALSSRRCLSFPRSRPSPATSGAASCRPTAGPARRSPARASSWLRTLRDEDPARFAAGVTGRRVEAIGRRGKQLIVDLSGGAFLTVHLKMTGQLFVVPASLAAGPVRAARAVARRRTRAAVPRHPQVRAGRAVRRRRRPVRRASGPSRSTRGSRCASSASASAGRRARLKPLLVDQAFIAGVGNIYADEALWRSRLHPLRTARTLRPADERRLYRRHRRGARRGRRASRLLDRRLHRARRRRRDAGAPRRLPAHRPAVPPLRAPDPADRDRHPRHPLLLVVPAAAGRAIARARRRSCAR